MDKVSHDNMAAVGETPHELDFVRESSAPSPRVTVAISLYNYERFIIECLESVRLQTLSSMDLIVVDDCSRDGSRETCRNWLSRHFQRFRKSQLLGHTANQGLAASRNLAFQHAETPYVFVLDADNLIYPRCTEVLAKALDHCDASFAYGYLEKFGVERGIVNCRPWDVRVLEEGNYIDAMSMIRRSAWAQVGGYSTDMGVPGWEDYEFWLKLAGQGGWGVLIPQFVARYRVHLSSMLRTNTNLRMTLIWDYLERKYPRIRRLPHVSDSWYRNQDEVLAYCERLRCVREPSGRCSLELRGWALARSGVARVDLLIDGHPIGQARYGDLRPDLSRRAECYPNGTRCGFSSHLVPPDEIEAGEHALTIRVTGTSGREFELQEVFSMEDRSLEGPSDTESHRAGIVFSSERVERDTIAIQLAE